MYKVLRQSAVFSTGALDGAPHKQVGGYDDTEESQEVAGADGSQLAGEGALLGLVEPEEMPRCLQLAENHHKVSHSLYVVNETSATGI